VVGKELSFTTAVAADGVRARQRRDVEDPAMNAPLSWPFVFVGHATPRGTSLHCMASGFGVPQQNVGMVAAERPVRDDVPAFRGSCHHLGRAV
jgi:hypothetical protein